MDRINFKYKTDGYYILKDLSADFKRNTLSVIVGRNGAEKTTLFDILMNLYELESGTILYNGISQKDISKKSIRHAISYIHQNPIIFNDSFKRNFQYIDENIKFDEIIKYCKMVDLHDFIISLPEEYDTVIGNGSMNISGGEKQRFAIALALAKKSSILLLDEITSDLDGNSENKIINILERISNDHTTIMISHRLTSIINIPNIYVLNNGKIVDKGNHSELINRSIEYMNIIGNLE